MSSLSDQLQAKLNTFSNTDKFWVIFVMDHIALIRQHSTIVDIDAAIVDRYKYKFEHFIRDNRCDASISWIASLANELTSYDEFTLKATILIPDLSYINTLYRKYRNSRNAG